MNMVQPGLPGRARLHCWDAAVSAAAKPTASPGNMNSLVFGGMHATSPVPHTVRASKEYDDCRVPSSRNCQPCTAWPGLSWLFLNHSSYATVPVVYKYSASLCRLVGPPGSLASLQSVLAPALHLARCKSTRQCPAWLHTVPQIVVQHSAYQAGNGACCQNTPYLQLT